MAAIGVCYIVYGLHEVNLFYVFHGVYPEAELVLCRFYFKKSNHYDFVAVDFSI